MQQTIFAIIMILLSVGTFLLMRRIYIRFPSPILMPLLTTTVLMIVILLVCHISYEEYLGGGKWLQSFLTPSVVALAYPLYKQRQVLKAHMIPIISGVVVGLLVALVSGFLFAKAFGLSRALVLSLVPKSLTTPVAIQVSSGIGGIASLTVVFVMIAGFTGMILGPNILKWARVKSPIGRGIAFGSGSHAIGTTKAFEFGELTASMSSVSMTLSALLGSVLGPIFVWLFQI